MREIKFKAWDKKNKKMYQVGGLELALDGKIHGVRCFQREGLLTDFIIREYTKRKDRNGVEIYADDITDLGNVSWSDVDGAWVLPDSLLAGKIVKVIGNIYEDPDLNREEW